LYDSLLNNFFFLSKEFYPVIAFSAIIAKVVIRIVQFSTLSIAFSMLSSILQQIIYFTLYLHLNIMFLFFFLIIFLRSLNKKKIL